MPPIAKAAPSRFRMKKGTTARFRVRRVDMNGAPVNLALVDVTSRLRQVLDLQDKIYSDPIIEIAITKADQSTDAGVGVYDLSVDTGAIDVGLYIGDVRYEEPSGAVMFTSSFYIEVLDSVS